MSWILPLQAEPVLLTFVASVTGRFALSPSSRNLFGGLASKHFLISNTPERQSTLPDSVKLRARSHWEALHRGRRHDRFCHRELLLRGDLPFIF